MSDFISRQDAISAVVNTSIPYCTFGRKSREYNALKRDAVYAIKALPSAEPKKGKWEMKPDPFGFFHDIPVCSECGCTPKMREKTKYCPNCGAKMLTKESTENLNLKADGEGVSKGGVSNGDTERHDSCSR